MLLNEKVQTRRRRKVTSNTEMQKSNIKITQAVRLLSTLLALSSTWLCFWFFGYSSESYKPQQFCCKQAIK